MCDHVLMRSDSKESRCMVTEPHTQHWDGRQIFWNDGDKGRWRVDGDALRAPGQEEYVDFADMVRIT